MAHIHGRIGSSPVLATWGCGPAWSGRYTVTVEIEGSNPFILAKVSGELSYGTLPPKGATLLTQSI